MIHEAKVGSHRLLRYFGKHRMLVQNIPKQNQSINLFYVNADLEQKKRFFTEIKLIENVVDVHIV